MSFQKRSSCGFATREVYRSQASLSETRLRGRMDVAFALVFRECLWEMVNHGGIAVFAAVDSSEILAHKLAGITR